MKDTPTEIETRLRRLMQSRSPAERLAMACSMFTTAKALVQAGILQEYGELQPQEMRRLMFQRMYGQDFAEAEKEKIINSLAT